MHHKLAIGFIVYGQSSAKYLDQFLPSLVQAVDHCGLDALIFAHDNGPAGFEANRQLLKQYPRIKLLGAGDNLGFAQANNAMIAAAIGAGADYFLAINPDTLLEVNAIANLLQALESNQSLGSVAPKLLRWDFSALSKTKIIDTCGIIMDSGLQFRDLGQGELDGGQYDQTAISGPSGAAALYRLSALAQIKDQYGYFDERFFMYKEDCDLVYRLHQAGFTSQLVPSSIIYHDRSVANQNFSLWGRFFNIFNKEAQSFCWSYFGDWLIFFKHFSSLSLTSKFVSLFYRSLALAYALVFNRALLVEIKKAKHASKS